MIEVPQSGTASSVAVDVLPVTGENGLTNCAPEQLSLAGPPVSAKAIS
ncbi:MAG: hypothetical protein IPP40_18310 [bacterium]|nr:hypothetical protein [bacterium]